MTEDLKFHLRSEYKITRREIEIVVHALTDMSNKDISEKLCIAEQTVKGHLNSIFKKLGIKKRYQLFVKLYKVAA